MRLRVERGKTRIEKNSYLGGAITSQLVVPAMKTDNRGLNVDFYNELVNTSRGQNAQITYIDGNTGWFNPLKLPDILNNMLSSVGCEIILGKKYIDAIHSNNISEGEQKIISLYIETNYIDNPLERICIEKKYNDNIKAARGKEKNEIFAKYFIDATGDANFAKLCIVCILCIYTANAFSSLSISAINLSACDFAFARSFSSSMQMLM